MLDLILTFSLLLFAACVPQVPEDDHGCAAACENLRGLGCEGAQGNPGGDERWGTEDDQTCEAACADIAEARMLPLNTECLSTVMGCQAADGC